MFENNWTLNNNIIAYWDSWELVTVKSLKQQYEYNQKFYLVNDHMIFTEMIVKKIENINGVCYVKLYVEEDLVKFGRMYYVVDSIGNKFELHIGKIIHDCHFDKFFYYDKNDLGSSYSPDATKFKVWSPIAIEMGLILIHPQSGAETKYRMARDFNCGTWEVNVPGNWEGYKYLYEVKVNFKTQRTIDPYAVASDANSKHSYVIDIEKTRIFEKKRFNDTIRSNVDAIIYEINVRDFTDNKYFKNRGKFLGLTERGLKNAENGAIGLDYLVDLGITHVQIMPIYDFATVNEDIPLSPDNYNWGYDPQQYNVPDGSYSIDPNDPYSRIMELKRMIYELNQANIGVIMDVVYNHVYNAPTFSWNILMPSYFFVFNPDGSYSNATHVGNDVASDRMMVRKYILDSVRFWQEEYNVSGFRFDLMGILDVTTMRKIVAQAKKFDASCLIYGEGWAMPNASLAIKADMYNARYMNQVAFFNDLFRNTIRGSHFGHDDNSFISGRRIHLKTVQNVMTGSLGLYEYHNLFNSASRSINYVEVHDNHTLWDHLALNLSHYNDDLKRAIHLLGSFLVLVSQGVPFFHAGQEFFRTKKLVENSYNAPLSINGLNWDDASKYQAQVELIKKVIKIRKNNKLFRLHHYYDIKAKTNLYFHESNVLVYDLKDDHNYFKVIINANNYPIDHQTAEGEWELLVSSTKLEEATIITHINLNEFGFCILKRH